MKDLLGIRQQERLLNKGLFLLNNALLISSPCTTSIKLASPKCFDKFNSSKQEAEHLLGKGSTHGTLIIKSYNKM
jgi:hypothetical protein